MDLSTLLDEDAARGTFRVHRTAMTSPDIYELERERIFDRCWLYVGHDSEIPAPGDYRRRTVADRPLFMVRGRDGVIRIFLNTCTHRGALVCRRDEGNAETFACFYHGWTFNNRGQLVGVPDPAGYSKGFDLSTRGLVAPPQVESYRGMYFVNFGVDVPTLADYLGEEVRDLIDLTMDSAELLGGYQVNNGSFQYDIRANWKLLSENSSDAYHLAMVHQTYISYMEFRHKEAGVSRAKQDNPLSRGIALKNGHVGMLSEYPGRPIATPSPLWSPETIAEVAELRKRLAERFGEARAHQMADVTRHLIIFPNVAFQDSPTGCRIRQWWPKGPGLMEVSQWDFAPRDENKEVRAYRLEGSLAFLGPGGLATPDDIEALESCQSGYRARECEWSDMSRGMQRDPRADDEYQTRAFWRQWHALIQGQAGAERLTDPAYAALAAQATQVA